MSNEWYDRLKWIFLIAIPAFAVATKGLGELWGIENVDQIVATINILATLGGTLLGVSNFNFNKENNIEVKPKENLNEVH